MADTVDKKELFELLRFLLGDKDRQKEIASRLEKIFNLSQTAEVFDGLAAAQAVDTAVKKLDELIAKN